MIFNKMIRLHESSIYLDGVKLEMLRRYKYLGYFITLSGEINTGQKELSDRAFNTSMEIKTIQGNLQARPQRIRF